MQAGYPKHRCYADFTHRSFAEFIKLHNASALRLALLGKSLPSVWPSKIPAFDLVLTNAWPSKVFSLASQLLPRRP